MKSSSRLLLTTMCLGLIAISCARRPSPGHTDAARKIKVVTTLFPLYDFARTIGGATAEVSLIVPPGVEPHSFEPRPADMIGIASADIFIYTGPVMEPWVARVLTAISSKKLIVVDASEGITLRNADITRTDTADPHIWLDFENAGKILTRIAKWMSWRDPVNGASYLSRSSRTVAALNDLDDRYRRGLSVCLSRTIVHAGHFTFAYLARRYRLDYLSATGSSPEAEPTPHRIVELRKRLESEKLAYLFTEEFVSPLVAETLAREAGVGILRLNAGHTVTTGELRSGTTFLSLMETNLATLRKGLDCK